MTLRPVPFQFSYPSPAHSLDEREEVHRISATFLECVHLLGQNACSRMLAFVEYMYTRENLLLFLMFLGEEVFTLDKRPVICTPFSIPPSTRS